MGYEDIKKTLTRQVELLNERCETCKDEELAALNEQIIQTVRCLYDLDLI